MHLMLSTDLTPYSLIYLKMYCKRSMCLDIKSGLHRDLQVLSNISQGPISELGVKSLVLHSQPPVDVSDLCYCYRTNCYSLIQKKPGIPFLILEGKGTWK